MASSNREGGVTFIWAIENFDPSFLGELVSPVFQSKSLDRTEWIISMDPNKNTDFISLVLTRCCAKNQEDHNKIILDCELAIIKEDGSSLVSKEIKNHGFTTDHTWSPCQNFASRDEVFYENSAEFILYNILRIRCRMWRRFNEGTQSELRWNHTKIERSLFVWELTNFSGLINNQIKTIAIKNSLPGTPTITLNFYREINNGEIVITIASHESSKLELFCQIAVMDYKGDISNDKCFECEVMNHVSTGAQEFRPQTWEFPSFIKYGELLKNRNLYLPRDVLSLRVDCFFWERNAVNEHASHVPIQNLQVCEDFPSSQNSSSQRKTELALSTSDKESMTENTERPQTCDKQCMTEIANIEISLDNSFENTHEKEPSIVKPTTHSLESFAHDLHSIYKEGLLSDFKLCAGSRTFPVHKNILSARSPVFKAMFTTPLKEKDGKTLDIPDIDGETLHRMLLFVYSNEIADLEWEDALNLYFAADKYNIEDLKNLTRSILKAKLSASNVCEIMVHADLHEDPELKTSAMEFIVENDQEVIGSEDWMKLQKTHIHLTMEIFSVLYKHNKAYETFVLKATTTADFIMTSTNRQDVVTLLWEIENFTQLFTHKLESPVFLSKSLDCTRWQLCLYPKAQLCDNINDDSISLSLTRCGSPNQEVHRIVLDCELSIIDDDEQTTLISKQITKHGFKENHSWSPCKGFVSRNDVFFERRSEFMPCNVLYVRCQMWKSYKETTMSELHISHTKIERSRFVWKINNFSCLKADEVKEMHVINSQSEFPVLSYRCYTDEINDEVIFEIESDKSNNIGICCEVMALDCLGKKIESNWQDFASYDENPYKFSPYLALSKLISNKAMYLPKDILSLRVDCFFWSSDIKDNTFPTTPIPNWRPRKSLHAAERKDRQETVAVPTRTNDEQSMTENVPSPRKCDKQCMTEAENTKVFHHKAETMREREICDVKPDTQQNFERYFKDMHCMYEEGLLSDFTLCVGNRTFPVHKNILSARSPVFKAMFTTPLKEKDGKTLDIPDIDGVTLNRMLLFVYSNEIADLEWEDAINLYFAADKYNIEDLKNLTRSILKAKLSVSNVCEIMVHADLHEDPELKSSAMDCIVENDQAIIGTDYWIKFQKKYMHLAMEILSVLYTVVRKRKD